MGRRRRCGGLDGESCLRSWCCRRSWHEESCSFFYHLRLRTCWRAFAIGLERKSAQLRKCPCARLGARSERETSCQPLNRFWVRKESSNKRRTKDDGRSRWFCRDSRDGFNGIKEKFDTSASLCELDEDSSRAF